MVERKKYKVVDECSLLTPLDNEYGCVNHCLVTRISENMTDEDYLDSLFFDGFEEFGRKDFYKCKFFNDLEDAIKYSSLLASKIDLWLKGEELMEAKSIVERLMADESYTSRFDDELNRRDVWASS